MQQIKWFLINGLFAAAIYYGFVEQMEGAYNLALFWAWVTILFSFLMLADEVNKKMTEKGRSVPRWLNVSYDLVITSAFVWFGAWFTGAFYFIHLMIQEFAWDKALKPESEDV